MATEWLITVGSNYSFYAAINLEYYITDIKLI